VVDPTSFAVDPTLHPTLPMKSDPPSVHELVNLIMPSINPVQEETSILIQYCVVSPEQPLVSFQESIPEQPLVDLVEEVSF